MAISSTIWPACVTVGATEHSRGRSISTCAVPADFTNDVRQMSK
jgi:hypothetical protein